VLLDLKGQILFYALNMYQQLVVDFWELIRRKLHVYYGPKDLYNSSLGGDI
jgi:hypothetical protein